VEQPQLRGSRETGLGYATGQVNQVPTLRNGKVYLGTRGNDSTVQGRTRKFTGCCELTRPQALESGVARHQRANVFLRFLVARRRRERVSRVRSATPSNICPTVANKNARAPRARRAGCAQACRSPFAVIVKKNGCRMAARFDNGRRVTLSVKSPRSRLRRVKTWRSVAVRIDEQPCADSNAPRYTNGHNA